MLYDTMLETETGAAQQSIMTSTWEASEQKELARTFEQLYCFQCVRLADSAFRCSGPLPAYHITPPIKFVSEQWIDSHRDRSTFTNAEPQNFLSASLLDIIGIYT